MMPDIAQWQLIAALAGIILTAMALLALAGLPVMGVAGQALARSRKRTSYDKCARQLAALAMGLGWAATLGGAVVVWLRLEAGGDALQALPASMEAVTAVRMQGDVLVWLALASGTLLISLYFALWRTLHKWPLLHQFLGLMAAVFFYLGVYGVISVVSADALVTLGEKSPESLGALFIPGEDSPLWNALGYLPPLALSMAGGLGALWLVLRRHRDDYGRDHYMQMLPWCAVWARNSWMVLWLLLAVFTAMDLWHIHTEDGALSGREMINALSFLLLWLIPGLLWTVVVRSAAPLRHKLTLLLALVLSTFFVMAVYTGLVGA